jgi:CCR4-NOT transcription complex subunit 2
VTNISTECYTTTKTDHRHSPSETLFFAFYQNPRGLEQEQAGIELHARFWRWHKILRKWLQKDTTEANRITSPVLVDLTNGAPIDGAVTRPTPTTERGVFIFFEPTPHWRRERREFTLNYDELDHRQGGDNAFGPPLAGLQ